MLESEDVLFFDESEDERFFDEVEADDSFLLELEASEEDASEVLVFSP